MDYGRIIKRAWHVTWRNKVLWIFGIAAALFGASSSNGGGGGHGSGAQAFVNVPEFGRIPDAPRHVEPFMGPGRGLRLPDWGFVQPMLPRLAPVVGTAIIVLGIIGFFWLIVSLIVRYTSYGAMIGMVRDIEDSEETTFKAGVAQGWKRLLHLLATDILIGIMAFVVVMIALLVVGIIAGLPLVPGILIVSARGSLTAIGVILIIVGALLAILLLMLVGLATSAATSLVREYAFRASVLDDAGVFDGLRTALQMCKHRSRESLLMWLLMAAIQLGLGILAFPLILIAMATIFGPGAAIFAATESIGAALLAAAPGFLIVTAASAVIGGVYLAWQSATWTLTYRELQSLQSLSE